MFPGREPFWWEEFLEIERNIFTDGRNPSLTLTLIETGRIVATADSILESNEVAIHYLNNLFEDIVLSAE